MNNDQIQKKIEINELIRSRRTYFDGAIGTLLQNKGLEAGETPESWNIKNPEVITEIHRSYVDAGCDFITTNTFGVNSLKYSNCKELIEAALKNAARGVEGSSAKIAFDVGPLGKLLEPLGDMSFEDAVRIFSETIEYAASLNIADVILIETMNDSYETKAAVLAAKECCDLPIFVTNAYDATGKLMTGASPAAMVALLEGLGVDALGINCSLGPELMIPAVKELIEYSSLPVIVSPNAGMPAYINGKTVYTLEAEDFGDSLKTIAELGASVLGGCCGTTPDYIKTTVSKTQSVPLPTIIEKHDTIVSSYTHIVKFENAPVVIGERINPTGKKALKEALRNGDMSLIISEAIKQTDFGADVLDVNTGLTEIDEKKMMVRAVREIQKVTDLPLQIDSSDPNVLEAAMRIYNGKPLVNSVNGKEEVMEAVFPLLKKYGGSVIALTIDEKGIPESAEERIAIAEKIASRAAEYGIKKKDIIVDPLALTVSSDQNGPSVTLNSLRMLKERGFNTVLGVSNVSFGLPRRDIINSSFLLCALESGLTSAIINPFDARMNEALYAYRLLHGLDEGCTEFIKYAAEHSQEQNVVKNDSISVFDAVLRGMKDAAISSASSEKCQSAPLAVINDQIIPALNEIGRRFEQKTAYLPQLLMSAEAAQGAISILKKYIISDVKAGRGQMILATVKGDIHDIGKNIVKVLLESYGFSVIDLGKDVAPEIVLESVKSSGCKLVGLSALMTTTVPAMQETTKMLHDYDSSIKVCVGGAVLTQEYSDLIGADKYCKDAMDTVRYAERYYEG